MLTLEEQERKALASPLAEPLPENIFESAQHATSMMINSHLQRREAAIRSALKSHDLSPEQTTELLVEAQGIAKLLKGTPERFIR